jgi:hypothetical protein
VASPAALAQLNAQVSTTTQEVELTIIARVGPQAPPSKLTAIVARQGSNATVRTKLW